MKKVETEQQVGVASIVNAQDFIQQYTQGIERFLRDNETTMGGDWVKNTGKKLYGGFKGVNEEGDLLGSSTDIGVATATFCPNFPQITGQQLLDLYHSAGKKNPFGSVYIDFGVYVNGTPKINHVQAQALLEDFSKRNINLKDRRVPDFVQLRLVANQESGLAYKLADGVEDVSSISTYPFINIGKNGLFRAYLDRNGDWDADVGDLPDSNGNGRVVRYDAFGVVQKSPEDDLAGTLTKEFLDKFK